MGSGSLRCHGTNVRVSKPIQRAQRSQLWFDSNGVHSLLNVSMPRRATADPTAAAVLPDDLALGVEEPPSVVDLDSSLCLHVVHDKDNRRFVWKAAKLAREGFIDHGSIAVLKWNHLVLSVSGAITLRGLAPAREVIWVGGWSTPVVRESLKLSQRKAAQVLTRDAEEAEFCKGV